MLQNPLTALAILTTIWHPALLMLPAKLRGLPADVLGLAIGEQESGFATRVQYGNGPAHGFWQMERAGGVRGVLTHPASANYAAAVCTALGVFPSDSAVWLALANNDRLGGAFARLLLWTSPAPLPAIGDEAAAWQYYVDLWRPGKPDRDRWVSAYAAAVAGVRRP